MKLIWPVTHQQYIRIAIGKMILKKNNALVFNMLENFDTF